MPGTFKEKQKGHTACWRAGEERCESNLERELGLDHFMQVSLGTWALTVNAIEVT
jgi:hypothetical protein